MRVGIVGLSHESNAFLRPSRSKRSTSEAEPAALT
jgi:hypothetical protein